MRTFAFGVAVALVLAGVTACSSDDDEQLSRSELFAAESSTPTPTPSSVEPTPSPPTPLPVNFDDLMLQIETEVPGFAGMLLDPVDNGILLVKTTRLEETDGAAVKAAIVARFPEMSDKTVELINAKYDFAQLSVWYEEIDVIWGWPGMVSSDVDEVRNKIVIGVESESDREPIEHAISQLPIPPDAIEVVVTGPVILL